MGEHFIERCVCGNVLSQCRCPGPKAARVRPGPCKCQKPAGGESKSALDEILSPENFPPCDVLRGEAVREIEALRAERDSAQIRWADAEKICRAQRAVLMECKAALVRADWYENSSWNGDLVGVGVELANTLSAASELIESLRAQLAALKPEHDRWYNLAVEQGKKIELLCKDIGTFKAQLAAAEERVRAVTAQKDGAYRERDALVCALSKLFPSHLARHPDEDTTWDNDWRWIVLVQLPTGQASWHIHDSEYEMFKHLPHGLNNWDGHTTEEKYRRLERI